MLREHPIVAAVLAACILGGGVAGLALLDADWTPLRRIAAGGVSGAGVGLLLTFTRFYG